LIIHSSIQGAREKSISLTHEMTNQENQELAARTVLTVVCIDTTTRKARPLPPDVRAHIATLFTTNPAE
jgi:acyl-CoA thioesterase FadM